MLAGQPTSGGGDRQRGAAATNPLLFVRFKFHIFRLQVALSNDPNLASERDTCHDSTCRCDKSTTSVTIFGQTSTRNGIRSV